MTLKLPRLPLHWKDTPQLFERYWDSLLTNLEKNVATVDVVSTTLTESRPASTFFSGPTSSAGSPAFRSIVATDIPTLNQNTTGSAATATTAGNVTGVVLPPNGGTGLTSLTVNTVPKGNGTSPWLPSSLTDDGVTVAINALLGLKVYTVSTLPSAGTLGRIACVSDATLPTYLGVLVGGGAIKTPVFDNGTAWVSF